MGAREEELKRRIVKACGSIPRFSEESGIPKSTVYNAIERGIENTRTGTMDNIMHYVVKFESEAEGTDPPVDTSELVSLYRAMSAESRAALLDVARRMK